MAMIKKYTLEGGTRVRIYDDEYKDATEEEMEARIKHMNQTISNLIIEKVYGKQVG